MQPASSGGGDGLSAPEAAVEGFVGTVAVATQKLMEHVPGTAEHAIRKQLDEVSRWGSCWREVEGRAGVLLPLINTPAFDKTGGRHLGRHGRAAGALSRRNRCAAARWQTVVGQGGILRRLCVWVTADNGARCQAAPCAGQPTLHLRNRIAHACTLTFCPCPRTVPRSCQGAPRHRDGAVLATG